MSPWCSSLTGFCVWGDIAPLRQKEILKIHFWGKVHFVLGLLTRDIVNYSYAQNTSSTQALNPLSAFIELEYLGICLK